MGPPPTHAGSRVCLCQRAHVFVPAGACVCASGHVCLCQRARVFVPAGACVYCFRSKKTKYLPFSKPFPENMVDQILTIYIIQPLFDKQFIHTIT